MMSRAQLPLEQGGTRQLARRGDVVELRTAALRLRLTREEVWQLAELLDRIATKADRD